MNVIDIDAMIAMAKSKAQSLRDHGTTTVADAQTKANVLFDEAANMDALVAILPTLPPLEASIIAALHDLITEANHAQ